MANKISNVNSDRIQWCCKTAAVDMQHLADKTKIKAEHLQQGQLTYNQLEKVANFFGYTPLFFLNEERPIAEKIHTAAFRSLANQEVGMDRSLARIIRQVEWHRDLYLDLAEGLGEGVASFAPPPLTGTLAEKASAVRKWLGLSDSTQYDYQAYRNLVEEQGVLVFQSAGYNGAWKLQDSNAIGFSIPHPQTPVIFVKKTSPEMQTFTLFHELGHILLHDDSCIDGQEQLAAGPAADAVTKEREANQFAGECLIPERMLPTAVPREAALYDDAYREIARQRGVSVEVVVVALVKHGSISWDEYADYKDIKERQRAERQQGAEEDRGGRRIRYREPLQIFGSPYVGTVMNAFCAGQITISKASKYLDRIKVSDIKQLQLSEI